DRTDQEQEDDYGREDEGPPPVPQERQDALLPRWGGLEPTPVEAWRGGGLLGPVLPSGRGVPDHVARIYPVACAFTRRRVWRFGKPPAVGNRLWSRLARAGQECLGQVGPIAVR